MNKKLLYSFITLLISVSTVLAQGPPNEEDNLFEPTLDVPVNSGILMVLAAGVGYGIKKLAKKK